MGRRCCCMGHEIFSLLFFIMLGMTLKVTTSYPRIPLVILRSTRRRSPSLVSGPSSSSSSLLVRRSLASNQPWPPKSQQQSTLEREIETITTANNNQTIHESLAKDNSTSSTSNNNNLLANTTTTSHPWSRGLVRSLRKSAGAVVSTTGFLTSSTISMIHDRAQWSRSKPTVIALQKFLNSSGIDLELSPTLNYHLLRNVVILGRIQGILNAKQQEDRRSQAKIKTVSHQQHDMIPSREEALRYMRYATAVYGSTMIAAAEMDARGIVDTRLSLLTKTKVSQHVHIPEDDIVLFDLDYGGDGKVLRHLLAIDRVHKKIVLAIRGTFTLAEIVVDVAGFSRKFYVFVFRTDVVWKKCVVPSVATQLTQLDLKNSFQHTLYTYNDKPTM